MQGLSHPAQLAYMLVFRRHMDKKTMISGNRPQITWQMIRAVVEYHPPRGSRAKAVVLKKSSQVRWIIDELVNAGLLERVGTMVYRCLKATAHHSAQMSNNTSTTQQQHSDNTEKPNGINVVTDDPENGLQKSLFVQQHISEDQDTETTKKKNKQKKKAETMTVSEVNAWSDENLPAYVDREAWDAFMLTRRQNKAQQTPFALKNIIRKIERWYGQYDINELLTKAHLNGWKDLYEPKAQSRPVQPSQKTYHSAGAGEW